MLVRETNPARGFVGAGTAKVIRGCLALTLATAPHWRRHLQPLTSPNASVHTHCSPVRTSYAEPHARSHAEPHARSHARTVARTHARTPHSAPAGRLAEPPSRFQHQLTQAPPLDHLTWTDCQPRAVTAAPCQRRSESVGLGVASVRPSPVNNAEAYGC